MDTLVDTDMRGRNFQFQHAKSLQIRNGAHPKVVTNQETVFAEFGSHAPLRSYLAGQMAMWQTRSQKVSAHSRHGANVPREFTPEVHVLSRLSGTLCIHAGLDEVPCDARPVCTIGTARWLLSLTAVVVLRPKRALALPWSCTVGVEARA